MSILDELFGPSQSYQGQTFSNLPPPVGPQGSGGQSNIPLALQVNMGANTQSQGLGPTPTTPLPDVSAPTNVDGVDVTVPAGKSQTYQAPSQNYNNSGDVQAVQQANAADKPPPGGYGKSAGLYGLLPQGLQHGTLRDVLGHLGDAFLVSTRRDPIYQPRQNSLAEGNAMAGAAQNPEAAISRVGALGIPGSPNNPGSVEQAEAQQQNQNNLQLHRDELQRQDIYRQAMIQNQQATQQARLDNSVNTIRGTAGGIVQPATNAQDYAKRYAQVDSMVKRIDPNANPTTAYGFPNPADWQPGDTSSAGMTGNNIQTSTDRGLARQQSNVNNIRSSAARISAASQFAAKPNLTEFQESVAAKVAEGTANAAEQQLFNKWVNIPKKATLANPGSNPQSGNNGGGGVLAPGALHNGYYVMTPQQAQTASQVQGNKGTKYYGMDGVLRTFH